MLQFLIRAPLDCLTAAGVTLALCRSCWPSRNCVSTENVCILLMLGMWYTRRVCSNKEVGSKSLEFTKRSHDTRRWPFVTLVASIQSHSKTLPSIPPNVISMCMNFLFSSLHQTSTRSEGKPKVYLCGIPSPWCQAGQRGISACRPWWLIT